MIKRNRGLWARAKAPLWAVRILLVTKKSGNREIAAAPTTPAIKMKKEKIAGGAAVISRTS